MTADDLRDWVKLATSFDALRVELLDAIDELEHSRDGLLFRAFTSLATDEPANRHPLAVLRHERAVALHGELRALFNSGELRRP